MKLRTQTQTLYPFFPLHPHPHPCPLLVLAYEVKFQPGPNTVMNEHSSRVIDSFFRFHGCLQFFICSHNGLAFRCFGMMYSQKIFFHKTYCTIFNILLRSVFFSTKTRQYRKKYQIDCDTCVQAAIMSLSNKRKKFQTVSQSVNQLRMVSLSVKKKSVTISLALASYATGEMFTANNIRLQKCSILSCTF